MKRHDNWHIHLDTILTELRDQPFESGQHDCALAASKIIHAMTGTDIGADFRGSYDTEIGAARCIKKAGFNSLEEMVDSVCAKHGMTPVNKNFEHRGDLVRFSDGVYGIVHLDGLSAVLVTTKGLAKRPLSEITKCWRVPYRETVGAI